MFESDNIKNLIERIRKLLEKEIKKRENNFIKYLKSREKSFFKKIVCEVDYDLIDWNSKGKDISKEEFLENEIFFENN